MADILEEIVAWKRLEVAAAKERKSYAQLEREVEMQTHQPIDMRQRLWDSASGIISEFKRKSPSKGWIHPDIEPEQVIPAYAENGAAAISCLTDEKYFGGRLEFIQRVRPILKDTPIMRKEFIVDEYQLLETRAIGADAVLLIAADLEVSEYLRLLRETHNLGMQALLEIHDEKELDYYEAAPDECDMLGVNNRHLGTFHTDVQHSVDIARSLPQEQVLVSESGISHPETIRMLRLAGYRGFLMGECFMKEQNPGQALKQFIQSI
ncbi:MAG: indole-3-glycerol phosphate synthase TrpC [Bacteroidaceae bacterium]|nr:indole-3-glycerol phosphate synthase TrpC [Bacteroidaceae bacterium]